MSAWNPRQIERRCLEQLDEAENWKLLNRPRPPESEVLSWQPFRRIFIFNVGVFGAVVALLLVVIGSASGMKASEALDPENSVPGAIVVLVGALTMGGLSAWLYRRSWNRRARWLLSQDTD
ncbi:MAG: hypothetical protein ACOYON_05960 [Fimbriimonas sp.]